MSAADDWAAPVTAIQPGASWRDVQLAPTIDGVLDGTLVDDVPDLVAVQGGGHLFYTGKVHSLHGVGGGGKTWLAMMSMAELLGQGRDVLYVDLEDRPKTLIDRLLVAGADPEQMRAHLHYKRPHEPLAVGVTELYDTVRQYSPALVVIDSVGEALAVEGANPNADEEVATWMRMAARGVADLGSTVLLLDHVPKSDERSLLPIGSQRKQAAVDGIVYALHGVTPFARDRKGMAKIVCGKDRQGQYARNQVVAEMHFEPQPDGPTSITLIAPARSPKNDDGTFRPTVVMEKISRLLEECAPPGMTGKQLRDIMGGNHETRETALNLLVREGYVNAVETARGGKLYSCRARYRQDEDPHRAAKDSDSAAAAEARDLPPGGPR